MTAAERTSRWARRFVLVGAAFLLAWQVGESLGAGLRAAVVLGVLGFVFHTIFGKAYSLVPAYFDRELVTTRLLPAHFGATLSGTILLAVDAELALRGAGAVGSLLWIGGVAVFLGTLLWSVRGNLTGRETGTGAANAERRPIDRIANAFVLVALLYLAVGSYALLAGQTPLPPVVDGYAPRSSHLLAAGGAAVLLLAVGVRLLPRFLVASPPKSLVTVVLLSGAIGPALLAGTLPSGLWFRVGAVVETIAVVGFAGTVLLLFVQSDRDRVGFYGVLAGVIAGASGALVGLVFAFGSPTPTLAAPRPALIAAHVRLNVLGFLGLSIVGVTYQFYPPAVGTFRGASDRGALAVLSLLVVGLSIEIIELLGGVAVAATAGRLCVVAGAAGHLRLLLGLFREQYG